MIHVDNYPEAAPSCHNRTPPPLTMQTSTALESQAWSLRLSSVTPSTRETCVLRFFTAPGHIEKLLLHAQRVQRGEWTLGKV